MLHFAASDLGLHFLPMSFLWDARFKWVNLALNKFYQDMFTVFEFGRFPHYPSIVLEITAILLFSMDIFSGFTCVSYY